MFTDDELYRNLLLEPLRTCADYVPKMGQGGSGVSLLGFQRLYGDDPLYHWMGFDSPQLYAAHKAAGGMTSLYRQLGIGCERLFRTVVQDACDLNDEQANWSYSIVVSGGVERKLSLDARVDLADLEDSAVLRRVADWLEAYRMKLDVKTELRGAVFEVRQGYKSKDSKRQNADLANAATAYTQGYLPILAVMSMQLDNVLRIRYEGAKMGVLAGVPNSEDPLTSTFAFCRQVVGYDLESFFLQCGAVARASRRHTRSAFGAIVMTRQNADLTFKGNVDAGRHGWLRLTPAYSVALVRKTLAEVPPGSRIIDPFSGTGTTGLCAAEMGFDAKLVDINPFLVWLAKAKTYGYSEEILTSSLDTLEETVSVAASYPAGAELWQPAIFNIERWWSPSNLASLKRLRAALDEQHEHPAKDLLLVAFCKTLIGVSNAAFNHQSMSFKPQSDTLPLWETEGDHILERFAQEFKHILDTARMGLHGKISVELADSRNLSTVRGPEFDVLYTSPPYANRMSYIRELRPYMYWLRFIEEAKEAGELDWTAIGGTWGMATSRLIGWEPSNFIPLGSTFESVVSEIGSLPEKNSALLARYVHRYFHDMWGHFQAARRILTPGGQAIYIVGNSTFFGKLVPTQEWYAELMLNAGFSEVTIEVLRKRNSKKELFEYAVTGHVG